VRRLGVAAAPARAVASQDGQWRFVSCSNVLPLKRVGLIAQVLQTLAQRHPQRRLAWTHFGDGPALPELRALVRAAPGNLQVTLAGRVPNEAVLAHYQTQPVDLLLLLSTSEGLPVSIQEALAHGIPVLATDVGGVAEAVHRIGDNGALVPAQASAADIVSALEALLLDTPERIEGRREAAWRAWQQDFDAQTNHAAWARELAAIQPHE
jgi:glycosyltransferase involved in cell wall biosynthesis